MLIDCAKTSLIASIYVRHTNLYNLSTLSCTLITRVQPLKSPFSVTNDFYSTSIALLGWFLLQHASLQWPCPCIELICYISKYNKLVQLVIKVWYHINVIYSLGAGTHIHRHTNIIYKSNFKKPGTHLV